MKISIIGCGYVGLITGACFAELGNEVICVDVVKGRVDMINRAKAPIYEQGLPRLLRRHVMVSKQLRATTDLEEAIFNTEITFICVGTPEKADGSIDLSYIEKVSRQIGYALKKKSAYHIVVVKSTVVPTTTDTVVKPILERASRKKAGKDFGLAMCPEFLKEGVAIEDFMHPDRIVIGAYDELSANVLEKLFTSFSCPKMVANLRTAEMIKYANNSFSAIKISFINEFANICERSSIDVNDVARGLGMDARVSKHFLFAGVGWAGSCLPKDTLAITKFAKKLGYTPQIIEAAQNVNIHQRRHLIQKIGEVKGKTVAVVGLAFKPGTDDMRHAPSITVIESLLRRGAKIRACDPIAVKNAKRIFGDNIVYCANLKSCISGADVVVILTEWDEYRVEPEFFKKHMRGNKIVDGRRVVDPVKAKKIGLDYFGIGYGG